MSRIACFIPAARWLGGYERRFVARDLGGGLAVGCMLIPQGLAFAQIVRVPPVQGLWSGVAAMMAYALFGPSRHLMVGPEAGTAMMVSAVLTAANMESPEQRLAGAAVLAAMIGAALVIAGLFRLGAISDFLSRPILVGYINGIALVLIASQLPGVLGIRSDANEFFPRVAEVASKLGSINWPTVWLSASALGFLLVSRRLLPLLPGAAVVVAVGIALSTLLHFQARGIRVLGNIDQGVPTIGFPSLRTGALLGLVPGALSVALLIYASSALTSRVFADKNHDAFRANGELFGLAAANFAASLLQGIPAAGSDARTVINDAARSHTQVAGLAPAGRRVRLGAPVRRGGSSCSHAEAGRGRLVAESRRVRPKCADPRPLHPALVYRRAGGRREPPAGVAGRRVRLRLDVDGRVHARREVPD